MKKRSVVLFSILILLFVPLVHAISLNEILSSIFSTTGEGFSSLIKCNDNIDGGKNFGVKGTTTLGKNKKTDYCMGNRLVEYFCSGELKIKNTIYTCPNGCNQGKCNSAPTLTCKYDVSNCPTWSTCTSSSQYCTATNCNTLTRSCTVQEGCTDPDGENYYIPSIVKQNEVTYQDKCVTPTTSNEGGYVLVNGVYYQYNNFEDDFCTGSNCYVAEAVCNNPQNFIIGTCPNGCKKGACLKVETIKTNESVKECWKDLDCKTVCPEGTTSYYCDIPNNWCHCNIETKPQIIVNETRIFSFCKEILQSIHKDTRWAIEDINTESVYYKIFLGERRSIPISGSYDFHLDCQNYLNMDIYKRQIYENKLDELSLKYNFNIGEPIAFLLWGWGNRESDIIKIENSTNFTQKCVGTYQTILQGSTVCGVTVIDVDEAETKCIVEYAGKTYIIDKGMSKTTEDNTILSLIEARAVHEAGVGQDKCIIKFGGNLIETPIGLQSPLKYCEDSPDGYDYFIPGSVKGEDNYGTILNVKDFCIDDKNLKEYGCASTSEGPWYGEHTYLCPNGCFNGACLQTGTVETPIQKCSGTYQTILQGSTICGVNVVDVDEAETKCIVEYARATYIIDKGQSKQLNNGTIISVIDVKAVHESGAGQDMCIIKFGGNLIEEIPETIQLPIQTKCDGCLVEGKCLPYGYRFNEMYCDISNELIKQKGQESFCNNNYECRANLCVSDKCVSTSLWNRFLSLFT